MGSKITADGDCSHEIKRRLLLVKEETDRAGLHPRPGCEREATPMVTLPVDSELCAPCLQK